jgi:2-polyprenyl-6-hydroxyphenyl methylase / 3-demethylubiquinone-9 3-methyltransferase
MQPDPATAYPSLDAAEVEKFSKLAAEWWNPKGKFGILHVFNPVRLTYIKEQVCARLGRDPLVERPFEGLRFLDIGCGGGLLTEPMARLGATIVGVDPSEKNIKTASVHAAEQNLAIDYRACTAEDLAAADEKFDVILNMEVIEHVADPQSFTKTCSAMLNDRGLIFVATLNRTLKSFGLAIVGAEYILGWLPRGTHQWEKFITPAELEAWLATYHVTIKAKSGVTFHPLENKWKLSRDLSVNYMLVGQRAAGDPTPA